MSDTPRDSDAEIDLLNLISEPDDETGDATPTEDAPDPEPAEEETEAEEQKADDKPTKHKIRAAGEDLELDYEELVRFAQKGIGADKKWLELDQKAKADAALIQVERQKLEAQAEQISEWLTALGETEAGQAHLEHLREFDYPEFKRFESMRNEAKKLAAQAQEAKQREIIERRNAEADEAVVQISKAFPEQWATEESRQKLLRSGAEFLMAAGMSTEALKEVTSGAVYIAAIKAKKYDDLIAKAAKLKEDKAPPKNVGQTPAKKQAVKSLEARVSELFS